MSKMFKGKAGAAWVWLAATVGVFIVVAMYVVFSYPFSMLVDYANSTINGTIYAPTLVKLQTIWLLWPMLLVFAAALLVIAWAIRRDTSEQFR